MKKYITLSIILILFSSCNKEIDSPQKNDITCNLESNAHAKSTAYQSTLDQYGGKDFVGLSLLIDHGNSGKWYGSSGYASIEDNIAMTPCHLHHTASLYKSFIAVIIMQLVDEGKIQLDQKISSILEETTLKKIPNGNTLSIKQLLQHRSGLVDVFEIDFILDFFNLPDNSYSKDELLKYMHKTKANSDPGTDFYYSDANFILLTLIIEKLDQKVFDAITTRIINELNLEDTYLLQNTKDYPDALSDSYWDRYGNKNIENVSDVQIALTAGLEGTDGIVSSTFDLNTFIKGLADGQLLSDASLIEMTSFAQVSQEEQEKHGIIGYGLGLMQVEISDEKWYGHFGDHIGSAAIMLYNPERKVTITAFQNTGTFLSYGTKRQFFGFFLNEIGSIIQQ